MKTALVFGSTGLVGGKLLRLLIKDKNNHYLIFGGQGTSNYSTDILKIMSDVDEIRKINGKEFTNLITKILNIIIL